MIKSIEESIKKALPDATVYATNPNGDGRHFEAIVISPSFEGLPLVKQHQIVMNAMKEEMESHVHALALKTFTPEKWAKEAKNYGH